MDCATGVHLTRNGGYINGSVRGLTCDELRDTGVCSLGRDTFWSAVLLGTRFSLGMSWFRSRLSDMDSGSRHSCRACQDRHPWVSGGLHSRDLVYRLAPEANLFRRMPTGTEAFLELLGVSGLRLCARTHLKKALYHTRPVGGTFDKYWHVRMQNRCEM